MQRITDSKMPKVKIVLLNLSDGNLSDDQYDSNTVVYKALSTLTDTEGTVLCTLYRLSDYRTPVSFDVELLAVFGDAANERNRCWHAYEKVTILSAPTSQHNKMRCLVQRTDKGASKPKVEWAKIQ